MNHLRRTRLVAVLVGGAALVAACSSSSASKATTTVATTTEVATTVAETTTEAPTTEAPTTVAETTTTVAAAGPVMPLTGQPVADPAFASRPALVVKIDNHPQARPQFGLNEADIVFEENVEHLTRFAAVFQSQDAKRVGPIRSGRTQDIALLGLLNKPLFAWSGGNPYVTNAIKNSDFTNLSPAAAGAKGGYFRNNRRGEDIEHTLYNSTPDLYAVAAGRGGTPPQQFTYRAADAAAVGAPSAGADLKMDGVNVSWGWNAKDSAYLRSEDGRPHSDALNGQVSAANVVILTVAYVPSPADVKSPEAQTIGSGAVTVLTGGNVITGTWTRADRLSPFTLTDANGAVIALTPGRTWVELARDGAVTVKG